MGNVLIMAGGESSRMKQSTGESLHKALTTVFDIPLIELNILYSYLYGFEKIWVSISSSETELIEYVKDLKQLYEERFQIQIKLIIEKIPLGTIGAVQFVECNSEPLLILFVDNILDLDLTALVASHLSAHAYITVASHVEPFKMPFGELVVSDTTIINYIEKPIYKILISSGTYVLNYEVRNFIRKEFYNKRLDVHNLTKILIDQSRPIHSYFHQAIWVDINDKATLLRTRDMQQWPVMQKIINIRNEFVSSK